MNKNKWLNRGILCLFTLACLFLTGTQVTANSSLTGKVRIDGSSTVFPITEAVAEEFGKIYPKVRVTVGVSGTGGGFKKFLAGEIDINDASRVIKESEVTRAQSAKIEYIELPIAFDGISVVINPQNDFVDHLTTEELKKIWQPASTVKLWSDVRANWPQQPIKLYGPGTDSGTFDYFTKAINGKSRASRPDYNASEDDNVLVRGVAGDKFALAYFGFAYYKENKSKLKAVPIKMTGESAVAHSEPTINNGTYQPLSRPIFIYVRKDVAAKPEIKAFVSFYLKNAATLSQEVGYVALPTPVYQTVLNRFESHRHGSAFFGKKTIGVNLLELLK